MMSEATSSSPNVVTDAIGGAPPSLNLPPAPGIIVTPIGVQRGGQRIAEREGIKVVRLAADSTTENYLLEFLGSVVVGPRAAKLTLTGGVPDVRITPVKPEQQ